MKRVKTLSIHVGIWNAEICQSHFRKEKEGKE
jgi:hypothetical protein